MTGRGRLGIHERVLVWDAALAAARSTLRRAGMHEVTTPVRLHAVAIEPWIEPVAAPPGLLATSPELPMKRLLCRGAPAIFQIAHVLRASERGRLHAEEFHLVEWYRHGADPSPVMRDVEALVADVGEAIGSVLEHAPPEPVPGTWRREGLLDLVERTIGVHLSGDEDADALAAALAPVRRQWPLALTDARDDDARDDELDPAVRALHAWTAFFSAWSDSALDPWLRSLHHAAVHVVEFPVALAALSEVAPSADATRRVGHRFESHLVVHGTAVELANGYRELRDPIEQARRFEVVLGLRSRHDLPPLPMPEAFLADLRGHGLPPVAGAALGLDRLVLLAAGASALDEVALLPD